MDGYSAKAKDEIVRLSSQLPCCRRAFLSALVHTGGSLVFSRDGMRISFPSLADKLSDKVTAIVSGLIDGVTAKKDASGFYLSGEKLYGALFALGIFEQEDGETAVVGGIKPFIISSECCVVNYLRGAFLGSGSVTLKKGYHLEFSLSNTALASDIVSLFARFDITAKVVERKERVVVYLKGGDAVSDALALMGASEAVLKLNNELALRQFRSDTNRRNNCELGNISKTVNASMRHIDDIKLIKRKIGIASLNEKLQMVAELRLDYPEDSLSELSARVGLNKSTLKNRLAKIEEIANEIRQKEERR